MVAGDGFRVDPGELQQHAGTVNEIAAELAQAVAAGEATTPLGSGAYGVLGQPFAALAQLSVSSAMHNLRTASETARQMAGGVGNAGSAYSRTDEGAAQHVRQAGEGL